MIRVFRNIEISGEAQAVQHHLSQCFLFPGKIFRQGSSIRLEEHQRVIFTWDDKGRGLENYYGA